MSEENGSTQPVRGVPAAVPEGPAVRDAAKILARAAADEAAADAERERLRSEPLAPLVPDERITPLLGAGETVFAVRRSVLFERRHGEQAEHGTGLGGDLYLTSARLVLLSRLTLSFKLESIDDVVLAGERLLLVLRSGQGGSLNTPQPRLLRVQIAAARTRARQASRG